MIGSTPVIMASIDEWPDCRTTTSNEARRSRGKLPSTVPKWSCSCSSKSRAGKSGPNVRDCQSPNVLRVSRVFANLENFQASNTVCELCKE